MVPIFNNKFIKDINITCFYSLLSIGQTNLFDQLSCKNQSSHNMDDGMETHSARRPRTLSGRPILVPYESFPDVLVRRGRRKDDFFLPQ